MYLEHRGQYSVATGINVDEGTKKIQLPEEIHDIQISAGYIPDGMEWMDDYKLNTLTHHIRVAFPYPGC